MEKLNFYLIDDQEKDLDRMGAAIDEAYGGEIRLRNCPYEIWVKKARTIEAGVALLSEQEHVHKGGIVILDVALDGANVYNTAQFGQRLVQKTREKLGVDQLPYAVILTTAHNVFEEVERLNRLVPERLGPVLFKDSRKGIFIIDQLKEHMVLFEQNYIEINGVWRRRDDLENILRDEPLGKRIFWRQNNQDRNLSLRDVIGFKKRDHHFEFFISGNGILIREQAANPRMDNPDGPPFNNNLHNMVLWPDQDNYRAVEDNPREVAWRFVQTASFRIPQMGNVEFFVNPIYWNNQKIDQLVEGINRKIVENLPRIRGGRWILSHGEPIMQTVFPVSFGERIIAEGMNANQLVPHILNRLLEGCGGEYLAIRNYKR